MSNSDLLPHFFFFVVEFLTWNCHGFPVVIHMNTCDTNVTFLVESFLPLFLKIGIGNMLLMNKIPDFNLR